MYRRGRAIFRGQPIRCVWIKEKECWFYSPIDFVKILSGSSNPRRYWCDLKRRQKIISDELYANCVQFRLDSKNGKRRQSNMVTVEVLEKIGIVLKLQGDRNFQGWIGNHKRYKKDKDLNHVHRKIIE